MGLVDWRHCSCDFRGTHSVGGFIRHHTFPLFMVLVLFMLKIALMTLMTELVSVISMRVISAQSYGEWVSRLPTRKSLKPLGQTDNEFYLLRQSLTASNIS